MSAAAWLPWIALVLVAAAVGTWEALRPAPAVENPLANATFSRVTNWAGTEEQAEISPDGRFVAFVADRVGQFDVWVSQLGTGDFKNLTEDVAPMVTPGNLLRSLGFNGEGSEIWFSRTGNPAGEKVLMALTGGTPRPFLATGDSDSLLVARQRPARVHRRDHATAIPCFSQTVPARTLIPSSRVVTRGRRHSSRKACTHTTRCGHRTANGFTSCTGRDRPAGWTCGA